MYVFISHSSKNSDVAEKACKKLEEEGIKCFLAPRDIQAGHMYADDILDALNSSDAVLLLLSRDADASPHVLREVERAVSKKIPVLVYKLEDFQVSKAMEYFLMTHQWMDPNQDKDMSLLVSKLKGLEKSKLAAGQETGEAALMAKDSVQELNSVAGASEIKGKSKAADSAENGGSNKSLIIALTAIAVLLIVLIILGIKLLFGKDKDEKPAEQLAVNTSIDEQKNMADASALESTEAPNVTEETVLTEAPETTENQAVTDTPSATEEPAMTATPVVTEEPAMTAAPVVTEEPAMTAAPAVTEEPAMTAAPVVTEEPVITEAPVVTAELQVTETPVTTETPIATEVPVITEVPADTAEAYSLMFKQLHVGDEVTFGTYMSVPIEWLVLHENSDGSKVLVSKYVLTMKPYDVAESGTYNEYEGISYWTDALKDDPKLQTMVRGNSNWDKSNIRAWLNSASKAVHYSDMRPGNSATSENHNGYEFEAGFLTGFTKEEQAVIVETTHVSQGNALVGGESIETTDKVYLLSVDELGWFEQAGLNMATVATSTAKSLDMAYYDKAFGYEAYFPWWLRDAVAESGCKGMLATNYYCMEYIVGVEGFGIRPAITVK